MSRRWRPKYKANHPDDAEPKRRHPSWRSLARQRTCPTCGLAWGPGVAHRSTRTGRWFVHYNGGRRRVRVSVESGKWSEAVAVWPIAGHDVAAVCRDEWHTIDPWSRRPKRTSRPNEETPRGWPARPEKRQAEIAGRVAERNDRNRKRQGKAAR